MKRMLVALLGVCSFSVFAQTAQKPNILFILVDNLGYGELGVYVVSTGEPLSSPMSCPS